MEKKVNNYLSRWFASSKAACEGQAPLDLSWGGKLEIEKVALPTSPRYGKLSNQRVG